MSRQSKAILATVAGVVAVFALPLVFGMAAMLITTVGWQMFLIIMALVVIVPLVVWLSTMRNSLDRGLRHCHDAWLDLDRELKRRHDLIARLLSTVGSRIADEREVLARLTLARNAAAASRGAPASRAKDENALNSALRRSLAIVDRYQELKADDGFLKLHEDLVNAENRLQSAVRIYNGNVADYNSRLQSSTSSLIAGAFGFKPREFFHAEPSPEHQTSRANARHPQEDSTPIPVGIVEPPPTESETAVNTSGRVVQEAPSPEVPQYAWVPRKVTRRTSLPAWPGWPSGFAGPHGPSS